MREAEIQEKQNSGSDSRGFSRRDLLRTISFAAAGIALSPLGRLARPTYARTPPLETFQTMAPGTSVAYPYSLPDLPYQPDALTAAIDEQTMRIHHGKHHKGYTDKFNAALKNHGDLQKKTVIELLYDIDSLPKEVQTAVRNAGGGFFNHALFWNLMSPNGGGNPTGELADVIDRDFGDFDTFRSEFSSKAGSLFGSGWAWLGMDSDGKLEIVQTANQDTPLEIGLKPVLGIDVWEHAYYLRYQNRRSDYIENFWKVVNWDQANRNFTA